MSLFKVIFLRHADYDDKGLTETGRTQMQRIGAQLTRRNIKPDSIYTSDAPRAYESGRVLASVFNMEVTNSMGILNPRGNADLREYLQTGDVFKGPNIVLVSHEEAIANYTHQLGGRAITVKVGHALITYINPANGNNCSFEEIAPTKI